MTLNSAIIFHEPFATEQLFYRGVTKSMKRLIFVGVILIGVLVILQAQLNKMPQLESVHDEQKEAKASADATTKEIEAFGLGLKSTPFTWADVQKAKGPIVKTKSGLRYVDIKAGKGDVCADMDVIAMNYAGFLRDGKQFDSSYLSPGHKATVLNVAGTVPGFREGLQGMKVGGRRKLLIPAYLGYGGRGQGPIPPGSNLIFIVDLLKVKHQTKGQD